MISAVFRRGGDVSFVVDELKAVFDPRGGHWVAGKYVPSLLAAIGEVIERHMIDIGFLAAPGQPAEGVAGRALKVVNLPTAGADGDGVRPDTRFRTCPKCGMLSLTRQENCDTCTSCGYSKCS
jgi:ribonucleoside-diphosphate reductase alpha chain